MGRDRALTPATHLGQWVLQAAPSWVAAALGWPRLLQACLCHTGRFSGRVSLDQDLPQHLPAPALGCRFGFECERSAVYIHKSPLFYPQRDFASQGRGKETPTPLHWEVGTWGTLLQVGSPAVPAREGCVLERVRFHPSVSACLSCFNIHTGSFKNKKTRCPLTFPSQLCWQHSRAVNGRIPRTHGLSLQSNRCSPTACAFRPFHSLG